MLSRTIVTTTDHLAHVVAHFKRYGEFCWDVETTRPYRGIPAHNTITWLSLATYGMAVTIPMGHTKGDRIIGYRTEPRKTKTGKIQNRKVPIWSAAPPQLRPSQVFEALEPLFFSDRVKVAHNLAFDAGSIAKYYGGRVIPRPWHDTYVSSVLLDENRSNGLKSLVKSIYGIDYDKSDVGKRVEEHRFRDVARYSYMDAKMTWLLYRRNQAAIRKAGLQKLFDLECELLEVVISMTAYGAPVDQATLEAFGKELRSRIVDHQARIFKALGRTINLDSPQQKAEALFLPKSKGGLGLKPITLTKGGQDKERRGEEITVHDYSTSAEVLEKYKDNPVVAALLDYQRDVKLLGTYVEGILNDEEDGSLIINGRIHASFNPVGARTGRWSSSNPNLQNIPTRTAEGKKIRSAFRAEPGHMYLVADYGQIELVMLAHFIGRGALYDGFFAGINPHVMTAAKIFGIPPEDVKTKHADLYSVAKGLNFAIVYSAGPATVAEQAGVTVKKAKEYMRKHRKEFPEIYAYREHVIKQARKKRPPHTTTLLGRIRRMPELLSKNEAKRAEAERKIFNSKIQGSAADLIKLAMVRWWRNHPEGAHMIMTVHDELVIHTPIELVDQAKEALRDAMVGPGIQKLVRVPLTIDMNVVDRWSEAK